MKKYFFGLAAFVFALGAVAFTNPEVIGKQRLNYQFFYTAPSGSYTDANVKDLTKWNISTISCDGTNTKACNIEVEESFTYDDNGTRKLRTAAQGGDIVSLTTAGTSTVKYVVSGTGVASVTNKSN